MSSQQSRMAKPYERLGKVLLQALGTRYSQKRLAELIYVTPAAVSCFVTGRSRPRPEKLGHMGALLELDPQHLAELARYDDDPYTNERVLASYKQWCVLHQHESVVSK